MASEREPGWYWVRFNGLNEVGHWRTEHLRYKADVPKHTEVGPRIHPPDAEHPDAALRERLGALADAWERESNPPERTYIERKSRGPYEEGKDDMLGECAQRIATLLTEGQPPHPALSADEAYAIMRQINTIAGDWRGDMLDGHEAIVRVRAVLATKEK